MSGSIATTPGVKRFIIDEAMLCIAQMADSIAEDMDLGAIDPCPGHEALRRFASLLRNRVTEEEHVQ
ncbi:MAG: hypothetical protein FJZ01_28085 [Candidatus Sericytochromatia bacterium]|nr:hypothetical protein [Candidatus Tanganyikabacteria bacterium]